MGKKRYVSIITVYTYGDDPKEGLKKANEIAESINDKFEGHEAKVEKFYSKEYGCMVPTEIDIEKIS